MRKFKTELIKEGSKTASRPCSVIRASDGKVLESFNSRRECAVALGIDSPTVSNMIYGRPSGSKLIDARYGELKIIDGAKIRDSLVTRS